MELFLLALFKIYQNHIYLHRIKLDLFLPVPERVEIHLTDTEHETKLNYKLSLSQFKHRFDSTLYCQLVEMQYIFWIRVRMNHVCTVERCRGGDTKFKISL